MYFLKLHSNPYISNICIPDQNSILTSQNICDHMFSDTYVDYNLRVIWLLTWIIFCFFSYVMIFHLQRRQEGIEIQVKLIPE